MSEQQQHRTREQTALDAEHLRVDVASLLLNRQYNGALTADADAFYEGRTTDEQEDALATADAVLALFSQPTPSAAPTCTCGHIMDDHDLSETGECQVAIPWCPCMAAKDATEPVSIADMALGTTFTARFTWTEDEYQFKVDSQGRVSFHVWEPMPRLDRIDPSTIRDVTPPRDAA